MVKRMQIQNWDSHPKVRRGNRTVKKIEEEKRLSGPASWEWRCALEVEENPRAEERKTRKSGLTLF